MAKKKGKLVGKTYGVKIYELDHGNIRVVDPGECKSHISAIYEATDDPYVRLEVFDDVTGYAGPVLIKTRHLRAILQHFEEEGGLLPFDID